MGPVFSIRCHVPLFFLQIYFAQVVLGPLYSHEDMFMLKSPYFPWSSHESPVASPNEMSIWTMTLVSTKARQNAEILER